MNLFTHFEMAVREAVAGLAADGQLAQGLPSAAIVVEAPRDPAHGDLSTNAAMVLAKPAGLKPRDLAERLVTRLAAHPDITEASVAGPGFINLRVVADVWQRVVRAAVREGTGYGRSGIGAGRKVNVEYVSANPTGPMHVGHARGAVFGDALANLLAFTGHEVTREYYINDAGAQIDVLARSVNLRYREALGEEIGAIPEGLYPGDYLVPVGEALAREHGERFRRSNGEDWLEPFRDAAVAAMMDMIRDDLAALNIRHDVFFSERSMHESGAIAGMLEELRGRDLVFQGSLPPPKGEVPEDWEDREQTLFRATAYGDDIDRPLVKSDGSFTYFAADVAYARDKLSRGFEELVYVLGADHGGYVKRLQAVTRALSADKAKATVLLCQLVKLYRAGQPVKMSKRAGTFVTLREVVDEVGCDPVRFIMLTRKNDAPLDFDFAEVTKKSAENPVFYVQYAHARAHSIFRNAADVYPKLGFDSGELANADLSLLTDVGEVAIVKRLAQYPKMLEGAATAYEPHRIAFYLYELASELHGQWNRGKDSPHLRFIREDDVSVTTARLALVRAVASTIAGGLALLGVHAPVEMR
ncbi:MAG: arginine--tRNA ligase [Rhizobiales bacterium]|nr:arginine--tRNA ligase [Hyphomicrobiales bacterium]